MSYSHDWGDASFDWKGLNDAEDMLSKELAKYRVPVRQIKEKFGQIRCYCSFGWASLHDFTHPGHAYIRYKEGSILYWLHYNRTFAWLWRNLIGTPSYFLHEWAYVRAYEKTVAAFPHLRGEITLAADFDELLTHLVPTKEERLVRRTEWERLHLDAEGNYIAKD